MKKIEAITVGQLVDHILETATTDSEKGNYYKTLTGPRTRGSLTELGLEFLAKPAGTAGIQQKVWELRNHLLTDITVEVNETARMPGCRYLSVDLPVGGRLGALPYHAAAQLGAVNIREHRVHGMELYLDKYPEDTIIPATDQITFVLSEEDDNTEWVATWHPGLPLASINAGISPNTAVKLHNGGDNQCRNMFPTVAINPFPFVTGGEPSPSRVPVNQMMGTPLASWNLVAEQGQKQISITTQHNDWEIVSDYDTYYWDIVKDNPNDDLVPMDENTRRLASEYGLFVYHFGDLNLLNDN